MLAGNEGGLVRRVTSFYNGDKFERDLVSISGVTTYIERIPFLDKRNMRAWVLQLDRYVDMFTPHVYTALAGVNDEDGDELHSARAQVAQMREESRRDEERRKSEELDRMSAEALNRKRSAQGGVERVRNDARGGSGAFSRVDAGGQAADADGARYGGDGYARGGAGMYPDGDGYARSGERGRYDGRGAGDAAGSAAQRMTYERASAGRGWEGAPERAAASARPAAPRRRPVPKPVESVIRELGLDGVLINAGLADGSFLRYVLERRIIFATWRRGWINRHTHAYVADASVSQAVVAELQLARVRLDSLRKRDLATPEQRARKIEQANVLFDSAQGIIDDAGASGRRVNLGGKLLVCDTIRPEQIERLRALGLGRMAVFTPMPEQAYVSTAELEAMLSFVDGREPRELHITDWEKLLDNARLVQLMFPLA